MLLDSFKGAIVAANTAAQIWVAWTEAYYGISGQDSVLRAVFNIFDSSFELSLFLVYSTLSRR